MGPLLPYMLIEFTKCSKFYAIQKFTTKTMQSQEKFKWHSNSNYGFQLAGPRGLFSKAAKNCFILLNGSVALKFVIRQPQRRVSITTDAFPACTEPIFMATGAFDYLRSICVAAFKKRSRGPALARSKGHN